MLAFPKKNKTTEDDDDEETQEVTASLAVSAININAAVLAQPDGSFGIKRRTKSTAKAFLGGKKCFQLSPNWLWPEFSETQ